MFEQPRSSAVRSMKLMTDLSHETNDLSLPCDLRTRLAAGCHFTSMEHQAGIALLFGVGHPAPALALLRPVFEAHIRGIWLSECADEDGIAAFSTGSWKDIPPIHSMIDCLENTKTFNTGVLRESHLKNWETLCGFTHTGIEQVSVSLTEDAIERNCTDEQVDEALGFANSCAILSGIAVASLAKNDQVACRILEIGKEFVCQSKD